MSRRGLARAWSTSLALVSALSSLGLLAQTETLRLPAFNGQPEPDCVVIDVSPVLAQHQRGGPAGFVTCTFENPDAQTHELAIRIEGWQGTASVRDRLRLQPKERVTRHYPMHRYGDSPVLLVEGERGTEVRSQHLGGGALPFSVLLITPRAEAVGEVQSPLSLIVASVAPAPTPRGTGALRAATPARGPGFGITEARPSLLPKTWACFAGFDLLIVDGRGAIEAASEQALVDTVAAGGALLVLWAESLADGPLRRAFGTRRIGQLAFGRFLVVNGAPQQSAELTQWLVGGSGEGVLDGVAHRHVSGPAADDLHTELEIPGLGRIPVGMFFVLLTLFVIVGGPINIFMCRRAKRPLLIAFTLPVLGFGFAAAILLWGVLAEGLGVRGTVRSLTWLDQRAHVSVNQAGATLFAGLTPSTLTPGSGTLVSGQIEDSRNGNSRRLVVDHASGGRGGRVSGSFLPARSPTNVTTVTHQRTRERLRFRRLQDGSLEALVGPGLVPTAPGIVVCDHAGQLYHGVPQGDRTVLTRVDASTAGVFLRDGREAFLNVPIMQRENERRYGISRPVAESDGSREALASGLRALFSHLQPGTYAAWVEDNAAFDTLGLVVAWEVRRHFVLGLLAEDDFVD